MKQTEIVVSMVSIYIFLNAGNAISEAQKVKTSLAPSETILTYQPPYNLPLQSIKPARKIPQTSKVVFINDIITIKLLEARSFDGHLELANNIYFFLFNSMLILPLYSLSSREHVQTNTVLPSQRQLGKFQPPHSFVSLLSPFKFPGVVIAIFRLQFRDAGCCRGLEKATCPQI